MRVISGQFKGRKLFSINNEKVRPTLGRAKESIFDILSSILKKKNKNYFDLTVVDGFCGTGALGIEALSRGAREVLFIDNSISSMDLVKKNCRFLKVEKKVYFYLCDILKIKKLNYSPNLFFLDPPYNFKDYDLLFKIFKQNKIFLEGAIVVLETSKRILFVEPVEFKLIRKQKISNSLFFFLEYSGSSAVE